MKKIVNRVYYHFNQQFKHTDEFFDFWCKHYAEVKDGKPVLKKLMPQFPIYVPTRWLSLIPAVDTIIECFDVLEDYFTSLETKQRRQSAKHKSKEVTYMYEFFKNSENYLWLVMISEFYTPFHLVVKQVQNNDATLMSGIYLTEKIKNRTKILLENANNRQLELPKNNESFNELYASYKNDEAFCKKIGTMYAICYKYLSKWTSYYENLMIFEWANLRKGLGEILNFYSQISSTYNLFADKQIVIAKTIPTKVEVKVSGKIITVQKNKKLNEEIKWLHEKLEMKVKVWTEEVSNVERWNQIFEEAKSSKQELLNISHLVQAILCLSPTNAICESVFSEINHFYSSEKSNLAIDTIESFVYVKYNITNSCYDFYQMRMKPGFLPRSVVKDSKKYQSKRKTKTAIQKDELEKKFNLNLLFN